MHISQTLARLGGVAPYSALEAIGISRSEIGQAVRSGEAIRVRNGWFACESAPEPLVKAVRVGGALTAGSVAQLHDLWTMPDELLHVRVPASASRLNSPTRSAPLDPHRDGVCVHYRREPVRSASDPIVPAIAEMFRCTDDVSAIVTLDSALNSGCLPLWQLPELRSLLGPSKRALLDRADHTSQSGLETIVRLLLHSHSIRYRSQVRIDGVGWVDLVVGDRLVLELDGKQFHSTSFENDRQRDWELVQRGYLVVRISYNMTMYERERIEAGLLVLIRRGEHKWRT